MRDPYEDRDYNTDSYLPEDKKVERSELRLKLAFAVYLASLLIGIGLDSAGLCLGVTGLFFVYMIFNLGGRFRR